MHSHPSNCQAFREDFFAVELKPSGTSQAVGGDAQHVACSDCSAWVAAQERLAGVLGTLTRHPAPAELARSVDEDAQLGTAGQPPLLRSLERRHAPLELDLAVDAGLKQLAKAPTWAALVGSLDRQLAPTVLERLVDEELQDQPAATVKRFAGSLFRRATPGSLERRLQADQLDSSATFGQLRWARSLGGVAAAALLVALFGWGLGDDAAPVDSPSGRFVVVEVQDLAGLDAFAFSLVEGLAGGRVSSVEPERFDSSGGPDANLTDGGGQR